MGWSAGSQLGQDIYNKIRGYIPREDRKEIASFIYDAVRDLDADDWDGTSQLEIDAEALVECWNCGEEYYISELDDEGLCEICLEDE